MAAWDGVSIGALLLMGLRELWKMALDFKRYVRWARIWR